MYFYFKYYITALIDNLRQCNPREQNNRVLWLSKQTYTFSICVVHEQNILILNSIYTGYIISFQNLPRK